MGLVFVAASCGSQGGESRDEGLTAAKSPSADGSRVDEDDSRDLDERAATDAEAIALPLPHPDENVEDLDPGSDAWFDREIERCQEHRRQGKSAEERQQRWEECTQKLEEESERQSQQPFASKANVTRIRGWEQALDWWPYRPVLGAPDEGLHEGSELVLYGSSHEKGDLTDPEREISLLLAVYESSEARTANSPYYAVVEGGGLFVTTEYWPVGSLQDRRHTEQGKAVTVRGEVAQLLELLRDGDPDETDGQAAANVNLRTIWWQRTTDSGGVVVWKVANDPTRYGREETLEWIEALEVMR